MSIVLWILLFLFCGLSLNRLIGHVRRRAGAKALSGEAPLREQRGCTVHLQQVRRPGERSAPGNRPQRATGDLFLTPTRLLLTSDQGILLDLRGANTPRLESIRATGPQRLVIEARPGAVGTSQQMPPGAFRLDLLVDDASAWIHALAQVFPDHVAATRGTPWAPKPPPA